MKTIYKYPLPIDSDTMLKVPKGAQFLSVHNQNERPTTWWLVDQEQQEKVEVPYQFFGTGWSLDESALWGMEFAGTVLLERGHFVFHLFLGRKVA